MDRKPDHEEQINKRPIIGITMGDPYGNGPELTAKLLADETVYDRCRPLVVGDLLPMLQAVRLLQETEGISLRIHPVAAVEDAFFVPGTIDVFICGKITEASEHKSVFEKRDRAPYGIGPCREGGEAAFTYVKTVIALAMTGQVQGTVTNALSKEAINMAGHHFAGHTEIYAYYTETKDYAMMLAHENLRVVHVSTHVSLREACDRVKKDRVLTCIRLADQACRSLGMERPKIAVAGLNPHCGEGGLFGTEEIQEIQPAIDAALQEGIWIPDEKPLPPDTVFSKAAGGLYDIVVVMYHDQGHIPLKLKGFVYNQKLQKWDAVAGVNLSLGMPVVRVSVDHGTGWDIAGTGEANVLSLKNATDYAIRLSRA